MSLWKSVVGLKKLRDEHLRTHYPFVFKWKWHSYRRYKVRIFVWVSSFLAHFLIKLKVKANHVTAIYAVMGILGAVFLAVPNKIATYVAICLFFFRAFFDWADGLVARVNKQTSINGAVFDAYGAWIGVVSLWSGLGLYLGHCTSSIFYYLSPVIPALYALDLHTNTRDILIYDNILQKNKQADIEIKPEKKDISQKGNIRRIKDTIDKIFQPNTRTVDFILLLILLETLMSVRVLWIFYSAFLIWQVMMFVYRFSLLTAGGWAEGELTNLRRIIYGHSDEQ